MAKRVGHWTAAAGVCDDFFPLIARAPAFRDRDAHPASVHFGTAEQIHTQRQATLKRAYAADPQRFTRDPGRTASSRGVYGMPW